MDQFEYVMVLVSIIVGLGIAHMLLGLGGIIDRLASRRHPLQVSVAYLSWLGVVFVWTTLFWWWEFQFSEFVTEWTIGLYFFLVLYAVALFLMSAVMVPRTWDPVDDLAEFFVERRLWFYSLQLLATGLDMIDSFLKGGIDRLLEAPFATLLVWTLTIVASGVGFGTKAVKYHAVMGVMLLVVQVSTAFDVLPTLSS